MVEERKQHGDEDPGLPIASRSAAFMTSLSPTGRSSPQPLSSLPPSPTEEDLGKRRVWDSEDGHEDPGRLDNVGKGKETAGTLSGGNYADGGTDEDLKKLGQEGDGHVLPEESYPPMTDEEAETKRVEEVRFIPHTGT